VTLSTSGSSGTTITWASDTSGTIAVDGMVTRPAFGSGNAPVVLTATIDKNGTNDTKAFTLTVIENLTLAGDSVTYTAGVAFNMVYVPGGLSFKTKEDDSGTDSVTNAYLIGETELTYELWNTVYTWATTSGGYTFANAGTMGDGTGNTDQHPVTAINWRDAMVWTNALTDYYNDQNSSSLVAVYYSDSGYTTLIKDSSDGSYASSVNSTPGSFDNPYIKSNADGFRLPSTAEWSLASRYKGSDSSNGAYEYPASSGNWWTPGSYASGATADNTDAAATGAVAVYSANSTAAVKSKAANALGLYDMSGNVWEWNLDWHPNYNGSARMFRGGGWNNSASLQVGYWNNSYPYGEFYNSGFRLSRTL